MKKPILFLVLLSLMFSSFLPAMEGNDKLTELISLISLEETSELGNSIASNSDLNNVFSDESCTGYGFALEVTDAPCGSTGSAWVTVSNGTPSYKLHVWGNGVDKEYWVNNSSFQITDIQPGSYSIKIVDANGCEELQTFTVVSLDCCTMDYVVEVTAAACGSTGSAWVTVSNGTPSYKLHVWGNGVDKEYWVNNSSFQITDIQAGAYNIKIVDANGCEVTKTFTVAAATNCCTMDYAIEVTAAGCNSTGSAWVTVTNGAPSYKLHIWGNGVDKEYWVNNSSFQITDIQAGAYNIKIVDANGCEVTKTFTVAAATNCCTMDYAIEVTAAGCNSTGSAWVTVTNGAPSYKLHIWGNGVDKEYWVNNSSFQITDIQAGTYNIKIVDANGCEVTKTFTVAAATNCCTMDYAIEVTAAGCNSTGSAWVTVTNGAPSYKLHIWGNGVDKEYWVNNSSFQITDIQPGTYNIKIVDANGCEKLKTFTVAGGGSNLDFAIEVTAGDCGSTGSAWVTVSNGSPSYKVHIWGNGVDKEYWVNNSSFQITDIQPGTYNIKIVDANGCEKTKTFSVANNGSNLTLAVEVTPASCSESGSLWCTVGNGSGPYSISWTGTATGSKTSSSNSFSLSGFAAGSYTLLVTDANGCSKSQTVSVGSSGGNLSLAIEATAASCSSPGSAWVTATNGTGPYSISWSGTSSGSKNTNTGNFAIPSLGAGSYTLVVTDYYGCSKTQTFTIGSSGGNISISAEVTNGSCGILGSIWTTVGGGQAPYTISWTGPSSGSATTNTSNYAITSLVAGTYSVTAKDAHGCAKTRAFTVSGNTSNITAAIEVTAASCGPTGSAWITIGGGTGPYDINITGPVVGNSSTSNGQYNIPNLLAGSYTLTAKDYNGCTVTKNFTVGGSSGSVQVGLNALLASCGQPGRISAQITGGTGAYTISWSGPVSGSATTNSNSYSIDNLVTGTYTVTATDYYGCTSSKTTTITQGSGTVAIGLTATNGSCGTAGLIGVTISGGQPNYTVSWTGPSSGSAGASAAGYTIPNLAAGTYTVSVADYYGCSTSKTVTIGNTGSTVAIGLQATNGSCGSAGSVGVTISGGQPNYTVSWTGPSSGSAGASAAGYTIPSLVAGTYTVTVADYYGCSTSKNVTVGNTGSTVAIGLTATNGSCGSAGSVGVTISGGQPNYTVSWTGPSSGSAGASAAGYTIPSLVAGTYTVTVADYYGCSTSKNVTVGNTGSTVAIGLQATNGSCGSAGSVGVTISGGQPNYTVSWTGPSSGSAGASAAGYTIPSLVAGTYTVTVADYYGCSTSKNVTVGNTGSTVAIGLQATNGSCGSAGSVGVTISGGQPNYTVSWTGPSSGSAGASAAGYTIPSLVAGTYTVTVADYYGCSTSKNVTVGAGHGSALSATASGGHGSCGQNGSINVAISGGVAGYTINWVGPATAFERVTSSNYTIPNLPAGTYSLTITDANGCYTTTTATVGSSAGSSVGLSIIGTNGACGSTGSAAVSITGGTPNYTLSWTGPSSGSVIAGSAGYTIPSLTAGTYTVSVLDANGCGLSKTVTIGGNTSSTVAIGLQATNGSCGSAGYVGVTISGGTPNYTVSWSGPSSGSAGASAAGYTIPSLVAGTYTVTVTDANGCSASKAVVVGAGSSSGISATASGGHGSCGQNGSINVAISGGVAGYTINWVGPVTAFERVTSSNYTIPNLPAGTYSLTITDASGCYTTTTATVGSSAGSTVGISVVGSNGSCGSAGSAAVTITGGTPNYTVSWTGPSSGSAGATSAGYTIPSLVAGNYIVTVTDANGCAASQAVNISSGASTLGVTASPSDGTCGNTGSIGVTISGGQPNYTVSWSGASTGSATAGSGGYTISDLAAGDYTITVKDFYGCSATTTAYIRGMSSSVAGTIQVVAGSCGSRGSIDVEFTRGVKPYTVSWSASDFQYINGDTYTIPDLAPGAYTVVLTDANGCHISEDVVVGSSSNSPVAISLAPSSASCGASGSIAVSITGGKANYTVSWSGPSSGSAIAGASGYTIPSLATGTYLVLVTDANGCTTSESVSVGSSGNGTVDFDMQSNHEACSSISEIVVTIKSGSPDYTITWSGPVSNSIKVSSTSYTIVNLTNGDYQITVTDAHGCASTQSISLQGGGGAPTVDFSYTVSGKQVQFKSSSSLGSSLWSFGDNLTSTETNPTHTYQNAGTYTACLDVTNDCGTAQKCYDVVIVGNVTDDGSTDTDTPDDNGNGNQQAPGASVVIATMSGSTGNVLQLPVTVENCGRLATFSGVFQVEDESVLAINGISPSAISPQFNRENNTFSFFSTGEGTEIDSETVLFYINVELKGKDGDATRVEIVDGRAELEMTCTDGENSGPVTPNITMGEITIGNSLTATIKGQVYTYWGEGIDEAQITIAGEEYHSDNMTTELGTYEAKDIPMNVEYKITPSKDGSPLNGISTYGLFVAQKYLLDYDPKEITSPYQIIAMDANCDNRFTTYDLFVLQQLVIGNITEFPDCPSWVFVRADQEFPEDFNDKNVFPYGSSYEMMMDQDGEADFVGVKVGDILGRAMASNQSFTQASSRSNDKMPLQVSRKTIAKGEEVELTFTSAQFEDMVSYQLGLQFDPTKLEVLEFVPTAKADLANTIAGVQRNQVNVSWYHASGNGLTISNSEALFTLKVRAKEDIENIIDLLTVSDNFDSEANSTEDVFGFELLAQDATATGTFELAQNNPNPFNSSTTITFELPVSSEVSLVVRDQFGRTVTTIQQAFEKGKGQLQLDRGDLSAGVYYYTLEAGDFTATKRMLIIE